MVVASAAPATRRFTVGLTGGIGSGKSAVGALLSELGAAVLDADQIAHELTAPGGAAIEPLRAAFGEAMITPQGALDRARMRAAVFANSAVRRRLEAILHPRIAAVLQQRAATVPGPYIVLVIPLLVEGSARWRGAVDRIAVVDCSSSLQVMRVTRRSGLHPQEVRAIIASQATRAERRRAADDIIDNSGDLAALQARVRQLHEQYLEMAGAI